MDEHDIKTMKLYHQVERVFNELTALGIGYDDPVDVELLSRFDQYHYFGTAAVDEGISRLSISQSMEVLEVGDILAGAPKEGCYDALVSWLTFLHISDRPTLYRRCFEALKPGASIYAEDFFDREQLTENERKVLSIDVASDYTPHFGTYYKDFVGAGFVNVELTDMTESWMDYSQQRVAAYRDNWSRNVALHGRELVAGLDHFYTSVDALFSGGNFGGLRIEALKPSELGV